MKNKTIEVKLAPAQKEALKASANAVEETMTDRALSIVFSEGKLRILARESDLANSYNQIQQLLNGDLLSNANLHTIQDQLTRNCIELEVLHCIATKVHTTQGIPYIPLSGGAENQPFTERLVLRVTPEDYNKLNGTASTIGMSISDLIRTLLYYKGIIIVLANSAEILKAFIRVYQRISELCMDDPSNADYGSLMQAVNKNYNMLNGLSALLTDIHTAYGEE